MKKAVLLLVCFVAGYFSFGQDSKSANTLLWRISGKQLTKPSYLYGTMHLTDKRVFQLGDSVYKALEQSEGFAAELDIDRLGTQLLNQFFKEKEEKNSKEPLKVKEVISPETWELYKTQLEKKLKKKADKITVDDLEDIDAKLQAELFKKGEMPTFLDAWLFGLARSQGKWVGGVEDFEDQMEHLFKDDIEEKIQSALYDDDYYRDGLDWFINVYNKQQLDSIDTYMYRDNGKKDYIMIKRNLKMARRMDSLAAIRSMLFAVGAAHLPGDSGVIELLRSRGFTVTPVVSSKKINPDKYSSKKVELPWVPVHVTDSSYSLQMPGTSEGIEMLESLGFDMKVFFDLAYMRMYMTMGIELPEDRKKLGADSLYNAFKSRYSSKGKVLKEKKVMVNGTEGREYTMTTDEGEIRMQVFLPEMRIVVMNFVFAFTSKSLADADPERFFKTFVYNKDYHKPEPQEKIWNQFSYPNLAFSVEMPIKAKETKDVNSQKGKINYAWQGIDLKDQIFYGMNVSVMKEGMFNSGSDSAYFLNIKNNLQEGFEDAKITDSAFFSMNGYPSFSLTIYGRSEGQYVETKILSVLRGGIMYYIYTVCEPGETNLASSKRYFNSFKLLPYNYQEWKRVTDPTGSYSTLSPFSFKAGHEIEEDDVHPGAERMMIYDSLGYTTSYFDKTIIPSWVWFESDTSFLRARIKQYANWSDSIENYIALEAGGQPTASFMVTTPGDHLVKKVKLVLNGNELYEIFGHYAANDIEKIYDSFYNEFKTTAVKPKTDRTVSRAADLAAMLPDADTETVKQVKYWWDYLDFKKEDVASLQKMFLTLYADFDSTTYANLNRKILDKLEFIDSIHSTVNYIRENYASIPAKDEYVKMFVIDYLSGLQTDESFKLLKDCLLNYSLNIGGKSYFSHSLYDSLKLTATLYPELLKLGSSESFWGVICGTATSLLDSNLLTTKSIKDYGSHFITTAKRVLDKEKEDIEEYAYSYTDLIRILGIINTTESNSLLVKFSKFNNREIRFRTLIAMLANNQPVDNKTIYTLATTDEYRHRLYDELKKINKLKLFPSEFLNQKALAKSKVYEYATDEEAPESVTFTGERTLNYKGKQQRFYLFKVTFSYHDDEHEASRNYHYLGIAGPYALSLKDLTSNHEQTGVHWEEEFDADRIDEMLKAYLESMEEENLDLP
ncbi:MAG TPA: TraB/GumN family protein [Chitinophagaceae bacterium]|nr:TraB/GumN family protein [Chitinophagaceae bacterium]